MRELIEQTSSRKIFFFLSFIFLFFYTIQISLITSNSDILVFSTRSLSSSPILKYAYFTDHYIFDQSHLPNYHIAFTIVQWLAYHAAPTALSKTIWPGGFVSALCGALIVGFTFLIWTRMLFRKSVAVVAAIIAGCIPNILNMNTCGELYSMQLASELIFAYCFLSDRIIAAILALLFTTLVSPMGGLSIALVFLAPKTRASFLKALLCALLAGALFFGVYHILHVNILHIFSALSAGHDRSLFFRIFKFGFLFVLNFSFSIFLLQRGSKILYLKHREIAVGLFLASIPWIALGLLDSKFLSMNTGFLMLLYWALALPIGIAIVELPHSFFSKALCFLGMATVYVVIWIIPNLSEGLSYAEAGYTVRSEIPDSIKIAGDWQAGVPITLSKYGWDFERLQRNFFSIDPRISKDSLLLKTGEKSLIIALSKKDGLRRRLNQMGAPLLVDEDFDEKVLSGTGTMRKLVDNESVMVYKWERKER